MRLLRGFSSGPEYKSNTYSPSVWRCKIGRHASLVSDQWSVEWSSMISKSMLDWSRDKLHQTCFEFEMGLDLAPIDMTQCTRFVKHIWQDFIKYGVR